MSQCTWSPHHWVCDEEEVSRKEQKEAHEVSSTIEDGGDGGDGVGAASWPGRSPRAWSLPSPPQTTVLMPLCLDLVLLVV